MSPADVLRFILLLFGLCGLTAGSTAKGGTCRPGAVMGLYPSQSGKRLEGHIVVTKDVISEEFCHVVCFVNADVCRSINFNHTKGHTGQYACEVNNSTARKHPGDLKTRAEFSYRETKDPCASNPCKGNKTCQPRVGPRGFQCVCPAGYSGDACKDINECEKQKPCHDKANCINTPGSYRCDCTEGYEGNGSHCEDINECRTQEPCHEKANCTNTPGSYRCNCTEGFKGNGSHCEDINECETQEPCHDKANCTNTPGSYRCNCTEGFKGNGSHCEDVDECAKFSPCDANASCKNSLGSYKCVCNTGFDGNGIYCESYFSQSDSKILKDHANDMKKLLEYLAPVQFSGKRWRLCYRASDNRYSASAFHTPCDKKGPTVTLVRVGNYVFGGYTDKSWDGSEGWISSDKAFLFSLKNRDDKEYKMAIYQNKAKAMYSGNNIGPSFGGGHDLHIRDNSKRSNSNLGDTYKLPGRYTYKSERAKSLLAGVDPFQWNEYEVFYQQDKS